MFVYICSANGDTDGGMVKGVLESHWSVAWWHVCVHPYSNPSTNGYKFLYP